MYLMIDPNPLQHTTYLSICDLYCSAFQGAQKWVSFSISVNLSQKDILSSFSLKAVISVLMGVLCLVSPMGVDWIDFVKDSITSLKETYNLTSDYILLSFYCRISHSHSLFSNCHKSVHFLSSLLHR